MNSDNEEARSLDLSSILVIGDISRQEKTDELRMVQSSVDQKREV